MSQYQALFVDVGFPKDKPPYPKNLPFPYVDWTQMLIPDRFREFVTMRYDNGGYLPCAISWHKKMKADEEWVNWMADQAGLPRPLHYFHNDSRMSHKSDKTIKKESKKWNQDSTGQLFGG
jgi:hypothetical protein